MPAYNWKDFGPPDPNLLVELEAKPIRIREITAEEFFANPHREFCWASGCCSIYGNLRDMMEISIASAKKEMRRRYWEDFVGWVTAEKPDKSTPTHGYHVMPFEDD